MRKPFQDFSGIAARIRGANINTDAIIPAAWLRSAHADFGRGLFARWRYSDAGSENAEFVLNREPFRRARILVADENFGCGSSREAAVWALMQFGIGCVLAPSFADIFYENAFRNGLLAGLIGPDVVAELDAARGDHRVWRSARARARAVLHVDRREPVLVAGDRDHRRGRADGEAGWEAGPARAADSSSAALFVWPLCATSAD